MAPLPKRKISKGRRDRRRAHDALKTRNLTQCTNCGESRLPHHVCPHCGYYKGREVISVESGHHRQKGHQHH
jgi:large subunit ribosomal protein L32